MERRAVRTICSRAVELGPRPIIDYPNYSLTRSRCDCTAGVSIRKVGLICLWQQVRVHRQRHVTLWLDIVGDSPDLGAKSYCCQGQSPSVSVMQLDQGWF